MDKEKIITSIRLLLTLILTVFITLKLCGVIKWSWFWVLSPLWLPFVVGIILLIITWLKNNLGNTNKVKIKNSNGNVIIQNNKEVEDE